jgi:3-deoxy-D-manno-octulosonic acid (KDO) 8-phosphate synthase
MAYQKKAPMKREIFFSQRMDMARRAEAWCVERGAALSSGNIVTALVSMGIIKKYTAAKTPNIVIGNQSAK